MCILVVIEVHLLYLQIEGSNEARLWNKIFDYTERKVCEVFDIRQNVNFVFLVRKSYSVAHWSRDLSSPTTVSLVSQH